MTIAVFVGGGKPGFAPYQPPASELKKVVFITRAESMERVFSACNENLICEKKENWKNCPSDCKKGGDDDEPKDTACYDFLSGAKPKWNWVEDYWSNDLNLLSSSNWATSVWNNAVSTQIFGNGHSGYYPWGEYDLFNGITYGNYSDPSVIGVTAIWYQGKNIYEYDIMYDIDYFPGKGYDLDTVVLHELGHAAGLNDLYTSECVDEVMYGYYTGVQTSLNTGDLAGITKLYG